MMKHSIVRWVLAVVSFATVGCAQEAPVGPQELWVIADVPVDLLVVPEYAIAPRRVTTDTVLPLATEHFTFHSRLAGFGDFSSAPVFEPRYEVDERGRVFPLDYPSLIAFTSAYNYERAYSFYQTIGLGTLVEEPSRYPVLIHARVGTGPVFPFAIDFSDNASFIALGPQGGFLVQPNRTLASSAVPFAASLFVTTHEMGHAMFYLLQPQLEGRYSRALDEGLADTFAFGATLDYQAFNDTVPAQQAARLEFRDPRTRQSWSRDDDALAGRNPYFLGSVLASSFYAWAELTSDAAGLQSRMREVAAVVFAALQSWRPGSGWHPVDFVDHVGATLPSGDSKDVFCSVMIASWGERGAELPSCVD